MGRGCASRARAAYGNATGGSGSRAERPTKQDYRPTTGEGLNASSRKKTSLTFV